MITSVKIWLISLFKNIIPSPKIDDELLNTMKKLDKYGGKIIVGDRGGIRMEFSSEENAQRFWEDELKCYKRIIDEN